MNALIDGAIDKARMILVILVFTLVAGTATYIGLPKEAEPEIAVPFVAVSVPLDGISPEDAERLIVRPAETQLQTIEGLKQMDGLAAEGIGQVILEFTTSFDPDQALLDVREKVDLAERDFPEDAREPVITEINTSLFPILVINLYGDVPERALYRVARSIQDDLEALSGVPEARVQGERVDALESIVDPGKRESYNLSYEEILATVTANNRLIPAGRIDTGAGRFPVKVPGLIKTAEDAINLPVRQSGDAVVTLSDIADIRRTFKDREVYGQFNGKPAIGIQVIKRSGANILTTVDEVKAVLEASSANWPEALKVELTSDNSYQIRSQVQQLQASIMTAVILVMIIVVAALGLRSAGLVGLAIPSSFVMSFLLLGIFGLTINTMVMFGMLIAVGILVDGAIVVVEYADRKMAEGADRKDAYALAAKRMAWPVVASNATTLAAFIPFLFWDSLVGKFMSYLPLTLIFVLVSSLVMALIFLPVVGSLFGRRAGGTGTDATLAALSGAEGDPLKAGGWIGGYARLTAMLINRPILVTGGLTGLIVAIFVWFGSTSHRSELFLDLEPEEVFIFVSAQGSLSAAEEFQIVRRVEEAVLNTEGVRSVSTTSGKTQGGISFLDGNGPSDTIGSMLVTLQSRRYGYDGRKAEEALREAVAQVPGARVEFQDREQGPESGKDVQIALRSENQAALEQATAMVRDRLDSMAGLREVEDTRPLPGLEWQIEVDRAQAGKFGVDLTQIGAAVQLVTNGVLVGRYRPDDALDEVDIRVRLPEGDRSIEALDDLRIATPEGQVPVSLFVDRVPAPRIASIDRRDGLRVFSVRANATVAGEGAARVAEIKDWMATANLPSDVEVFFEGADEDAAEASAFFQNAALAALFLMAVILLWEFNNFYHVFLTLTAVIISTAGVLIGIQVFLSYISILMIGTGVVALAGIVVNNNIVLIDTFQRLREDGRTAGEAAIASAAQRVRPIFLTTITTICGLLPMMFQMNVNFREGLITFGGGTAEWWVQLSTAVVFGLGFSTIVTLIVTPVWLAVPERIARFRARLRKPPGRGVVDFPAAAGAGSARPAAAAE